MGELLTPPGYRELAGPLIFLAGPIQGAPPWREEAITLLRAEPRLHIASPEWPKSTASDFGGQRYAVQMEWEHRHLERAGECGAILFWLAREVKHDCSRAYAQTSRFELGEAVALHCCKAIRVVVGIEEGFSNARYLKHTIGKKAPHIPLCSTLAETCRQAIALARQ